jgi:hypothetical protein
MQFCAIHEDRLFCTAHPSDRVAFAVPKTVYAFSEYLVQHSSTMQNINLQMNVTVLGH